MIQLEPPKPLPETDWLAFVKDFHPSVHARLAEMIAREGADGLFTIQCEDLSSSQIGSRSAVVYGPECTFKAADLHLGRIVGSLPSNMKSMKHRVTRAAYETARAAGWKPAQLKRTPLPTVTKFGQLEEGDEFDFVSPDPVMNSFLKKCHKTGRFKYRDEDGEEHRVGSTSAKVYHVVRETYE